MKKYLVLIGNLPGQDTFDVEAFSSLEEAEERARRIRVFYQKNNFYNVSVGIAELLKKVEE